MQEIRLKCFVWFLAIFAAFLVLSIVRIAVPDAILNEHPKSHELSKGMILAGICMLAPFIAIVVGAIFLKESILPDPSQPNSTFLPLAIVYGGYFIYEGSGPPYGAVRICFSVITVGMFLALCKMYSLWARQVAASLPEGHPMIFKPPSKVAGGQSA